MTVFYQDQDNSSSLGMNLTTSQIFGYSIILWLEMHHWIDLHLIKSDGDRYVSVPLDQMIAHLPMRVSRTTCVNDEI